MTAPDETVQPAPPANGRGSFGSAASRSSLKDRLTGVENVLAVISSVLLPFGLVVILLGWYGASRTPNLFEQIPYLISGGLVGIALVVGAGLLYLGSWVAAAARDQRAVSAELLTVLQQIREEVQSRPVDVPVPGSRVRREASGGRAHGRTKGVPNGVVSGAGHGADSGSEFVATSSGSMLHRPDCAVVADRSDLRAVDPETTSLRPCRLCDPLGVRKLSPVRA